MMIEAEGKNSTVVNKNIQKNHLGEIDFSYHRRGVAL